ncbi:fluoride efflux transporter CrcB [Ascidiimonas sp. W6]|uniref:fluoride efflux transporter CrcB n=1 Tax=Ascidiimonas meishanensis TaxID=3128903 RepID=UPI0030EDBA0F
MKQLLLVFLGGGLGSSLRYMITKWLNPNFTIPLGTLAVNIIGSLLIGIILGLASRGNTISTSQTLLLATGFCGGFTTFSTFSFENNAFLKSGDFLNFALYTILSISGGIFAVMTGFWISKQL